MHNANHSAARPVQRNLSLRRPEWIGAGGKVAVHGRDAEAFADPGSYVALRRTWRAGDRIKLTLPMQVWTEPLPGEPQTRAVMYGPLVLAANLGAGPKAGPTKIIHGRDTAPKDVPEPQPYPSAPTVAAEHAEAIPD